MLNKQTAIERLRARLPEADDALLEMLLADAACAICAYTRRREVPQALTGAQVELATVYYNRLGIEGEISHSEGGVSRGMEALPEGIMAQIRPFRLAVAGK